MWAKLLPEIATTLQAQLPGVTVKTHTDAEVPTPDPDIPGDTADTVRVLRGTSTGRPYYGRPSGQQSINLELWTTHADYAAADYRLMLLEDAVLRALEQLPRTAAHVFNLEILGIDPDGDLFRPTVGSQIRLNVYWRTTD